MARRASLRVVVVGLGVQGQKRRLVAGPDAVATVDPVHPDATYQALEDEHFKQLCSRGESNIENDLWINTTLNALERDPASVCALADRTGIDASVARAFIANSGHRQEWTWRTLRERVLDGRPDARIGVLGLAYKIDTQSTKGSPALALLAHLDGCRVRVFDPVVPGAAAGPSVFAAGNALEAADGTDALCVMTPWREFADLPLAELACRMRGRVLIDPFAAFDRAATRAAGFDCLTLGLGDMPQATAC